MTVQQRRKRNTVDDGIGIINDNVGIELQRRQVAPLRRLVAQSRNSISSTYMALLVAIGATKEKSRDTIGCVQNQMTNGHIVGETKNRRAPILRRPQDC